MPEPANAVAYLLSANDQPEQLERIADLVRSTYEFFEVRTITDAEDAFEAEVIGSDLVVAVCDQENDLPFFDRAFWKYMRALGPATVLVTPFAHFRSGPEPFENFHPFCLEDLDTLEFRQHLGTMLELAGGYIYLAYANPDGLNFATQMYDALQAKGYPVFFDRAPGTTGPRRMITSALSPAARSAVCTVLIDTPDAFDSSNVREEVRKALGQGQIVIPFFWRADTELKKLTSRFPGLKQFKHGTRSEDTGGVIEPPALQKFIAIMEAYLHDRFQRKKRVHHHARYMFGAYEYSWDAENPDRLTYVSSGPQSSADETRQLGVLSYCLRRRVDKRPATHAFAHYLPVVPSPAEFHHRFFIHDNLNILSRSSICRLSRRPSQYRMLELLHWGQIPNKLRELHAKLP